LQSGEKKSSKNSSRRASLGKSGEAFVALALQSRGYKILDCNYRKRFGEIDIIAEKNEVITFVEVKCRAKKYFHLSEVVNYSKQKKIILTAKNYLSTNRVSDRALRFDVALVEKYNDNYSLNYIKDAFTEKNE
jgi:putative endonuclease